eukprot:scaffold89723_cov18-Prasinocladus_malaysianus.AAC.1
MNNLLPSCDRSSIGKNSHAVARPMNYVARMHFIACFPTGLYLGMNCCPPDNNLLELGNELVITYHAGRHICGDYTTICLAAGDCSNTPGQGKTYKRPFKTAAEESST